LPTQPFSFSNSPSDVFPYERAGHHDLDDRNAAFALALLGEALTDDGVQVERELLLLKVFHLRVEQ